MTEDHVGNSTPFKSNLKTTSEKQTTPTSTGKKKLRGWEKVRDEVTHPDSQQQQDNNFASSSRQTTFTSAKDNSHSLSPTNNATFYNSSPLKLTPTSYSTSPALMQSQQQQQQPQQRKFNPFQRTPVDYDRKQPNFANTTLAAAQAAGMTNFTRNFRPVNHGARHNIYATTTAVQQDIYKLERELNKLFLQVNTRTQNASFVEKSSSSSSIDIHKSDESLNGVKKNHTGNRFLGTRQSKMDMFSTAAAATAEAPPIHETIKFEDEADHTRFVLTSVMDIILKHKSATRLPLTQEILAVLTIPFDTSPINAQDCIQSLDLFDYIRNRFKLLDATERFEQVIFCSRLLGLGDSKIKTRVYDTLEDMLQPCTTHPDHLPCSPTAFHSLVYTLTDGLSKLDVTKTDTSIRSGILAILDKLSQGKLMQFNDSDMTHWKSYTQDTTTTTIPTSVAQYCVLEGLCKCLMVGICNQTNPYKGVIENVELIERTRDRIVLKELFPRYWPDSTTMDDQSRPAYYKIIFLVSEIACETFLTASMDDLKVKTSTISLLLPLIIEKLTPAKLSHYLSQRDTDENQKVLTYNIMTMILGLLSICSLDDSSTRHTTGGRPSSPSLSPQPSLQDFHPDSLSISDSLDQKSIRSLSSSTTTNIQQQQQQTKKSIKSYVSDFYKSGYKDIMIKATESMLQDASGERVARTYQNLLFYIDPKVMGEEMARATIPSLFKRISESYPPTIPAFCNMLVEIAKRYKQVFYKPVVSCVASDDELKVSNIMKLLTCMKRYMSGVQFWMQDAEMINVLLLSDVGTRKQREHNNTSTTNANTTTTRTTSSSTTTTPQLKINDAPHEASWGNTTLGQCTIASEFMWCIKELREKQSDPTRNMEEDEIAKKFLIDLERRLAVFLTAKEKTILVPLPLRVILCNIFMDIRFFCFTTHRPGWLTRTIDWATQPVVATPEHPFHLHDVMYEESVVEESKLGTMHMGHLQESDTMFERIRGVYMILVEELKWESPDDKNDYSNYRINHRRSRLEMEGMEEIEEGDIGVEVGVGVGVGSHLHSQNDGTSTSLPPRHKRQQVISSMYPMTHNDALALDLNPPLATTTTTENKFATTEDPTASGNGGPAYTIAKYKFDHMYDKVKLDAFGSVFSLLATVFTTLSSQEFTRLIRPLWDRFIDDRKPQSFIPAAFLLLQCGEKIPKVMIEVSTHDFYSGEPLRRLSVIQKHSTLSAFRFNVLGQEYIPISSRKRPFRGDGGAFSTPFVPTDLGSNQFTLDEPRWMSKLKNASNFPLELKRQIQELGWDDDDQGEEQEALKKVLTPLALLPSLYLEEEDERLNETEESAATTALKKKHVNISRIINRRKRATTIQSMTISFLSMVDLLNDDYGGASNALRELLQYFLRDDPSLFLRPFLSDLGKFKLERHRDMLTRIRYLCSMQHKLPPGFIHILFNYLSGMLKWLARESKNKDESLILMTLIHPILAELILSTNDLSIRDLRKNKIEHLLISTGRFWFTHEQPPEMFPRYLSNNRTPFSVLDIPLDIFSVAMIRMSHIQFLTNYLVRYPREVYAVKKTLQDYEPVPIPGNINRSSSTAASTSFHWNPNANDHFFPDMTKRQGSSASFIRDETVHRKELTQQQLDTIALSSLRARIWLRFIDNLLMGLNKNYNDRNELERILMGINTILAEHEDDFGIIGQTLILYTRVVTRFKRLFISNRGYTTFLRALFKVFCQVDGYPQVRSAILFSWCRFYAVHEESFVFQMLGTLVPTILSAFQKDEALGRWMLDNLYTLMETMNNPPHLGAAPDTLGLQLQVELDDHERNIQERIDAVSNPMVVASSLPLSTAILKPLARSVTTPMLPFTVTNNNYSNKAFEMQNFIKLFLTVIAYDPGSLRAEQFVKIFKKLMTKFTMEGNEELKHLLDEGIVALVDVFVKFSKNAKPSAAMNGPHTSAATGGGGGGGGGGAATAATGGPSNDEGYNAAAGVANGLGIAIPGMEGHQSNNNNNHTNNSGTTPLSSNDNGLGNNNNNNSEGAQQAYGKQWQQNDRLSIKKEFVLLVHEYLKCGGSLTDVYHEKMASIIKFVMRDYGTIKGLVCPTDWIKDYLIDCLHSMIDIRNNIKSFKRVVHQIFVQYRVQWKSVDGADLFHGLAIVLEQGQGKAVAMHDIAGVMREKFIPFGLTVSTRYDWNNDSRKHLEFSNAVVRLIIAILENSTQDVIHEIEQQVPSPNLMSFIIIPICLQYNLQWDFANTNMGNKFRPDPTSNWTRLLGFVSRACSQASLLKNKSSGFSLSQLTAGVKDTSLHHDTNNNDAIDFPDLKDSKQTPQTVALLFSLCFVAIKIILVRGAKSFNKMTGSWAQVAFFSRNALAFGQSLKFLKSKNQQQQQQQQQQQSGSGRSSPNNLSPIALSPVNWTTSQPSESRGGGGGAMFSFTAPVGNSTIYDFTTWRFLEFVIYYRSPLFIFLKDFIHEKLTEIGAPNQHQRSSIYSPSPISNFGPPSPFSQATTSKSKISRWKSWGGPSIQQQSTTNSGSNIAYSPSGIIPQVNVQEAEEDHYMPPTQGLGLHIPTSSQRSSYVPPIPSSPSLDIPIINQQQQQQQPQDWHSHSRTSTSTHPSSIQSNQQQPSAPHLSNAHSPNKSVENEDLSSTFHLLHAESITSVVNIQLAMGFKPALPWMATKPRQQLKPWENRDAVRKMTNEWQLLSQLDSDDAAGGLQKLASNNMSNSFIPMTPH